jgi:hypothetical protein
MLMVWEDNIDLGEGIIRIHLLNLICAVHLRQADGFKHWPDGHVQETLRTYLILFWVGFLALFRGFSQIMHAFTIRHAGQAAAIDPAGPR